MEKAHFQPRTMRHRASALASAMSLLRLSIPTVLKIALLSLMLPMSLASHEFTRDEFFFEQSDLNEQRE